MRTPPGARGDYGLGRTVTLSCRLTEAEASTLRSRADQAGLATSEYVRRIALVPSWRPLGRDAVERLGALRNQLRLAGNNLNQLTRMAHLVGLGERRAGPLAADLARAISEVRRLGDEIGRAVDGVAAVPETAPARERRRR